MVARAIPINDVHELRACELCTHHDTAPTGLVCTNPLVRQTTAPVPCMQARRAEGLCGIDARHQLWPHLEHQLQRRAVPISLPLFTNLQVPA